MFHGLRKQEKKVFAVLEKGEWLVTHCWATLKYWLFEVDQMHSSLSDTRKKNGDYLFIDLLQEIFHGLVQNARMQYQGISPFI